MLQLLPAALKPRCSLSGNARWIALGLAMLCLLPLTGATADEAKKPEDKPAAAAPLQPPKDVAEFRGIEEKIKRMTAKVLPCIVAVRVGPSQGSGVIVSKDGLVLTAGHVIGEPKKELAIVLADGRTLKGQSLGVYQDADAGLAKITENGEWPHLEMGRTENLPLGAWCMAFGHPLGLQRDRPAVVRFGRVLRTGESMLQTDCTLVAGDSGGPLVDLDGRVIGINSRINAAMTTVNLHVPVDVFHKNWERLLKADAWRTQVSGKDSSEVKSALGSLTGEAGRCTVRVKSGDKPLALGTIVGPDGWILTKASELEGPLVCRLRDGSECPARIVGVHEGFDLAMLKIERTGLPRIGWATQAKYDVGQMVATANCEEGPPLALGVVGVPLRKIPAASGILGIVMAEQESPAKIIKILPDSPAAKAGLQEDDVVTHLNDKPTNGRIDLIGQLKTFRPGTSLKLTVKRGEQIVQIMATLGKLDNPGTRKRDMQNLGGPGVNDRHDDFPQVLQHDTVLRPIDCGGPLVDLSGQVVGVNIARAGRTETYAVPTGVLLPLMYELMSGRLPPKQESKPEPKPEPKPEVKPQPAPKTEPKPEVKPEPKREAKPQPKPEAKPEKPDAEKKPENKPQEKSESRLEGKPEVADLPPIPIRE